MLCRPYASVSAKQTRHFQAMGQCVKEMRQQNSLMYHMKLKNLCRFSGSVTKLSFLNSLPSGVYPHHGSGLLSACPGCLPQRPGLSPYLCSHSTI